MLIAEVAWAAGFLEGEGSFGSSRDEHGSFTRISAPQVQREPLERLQRLMGGKIYNRTCGVHQWGLTKRAAGWMTALYPQMSTRRKEQIRRALAVWELGRQSWTGPNRCKGTK